MRLFALLLSFACAAFAEKEEIPFEEQIAQSVPLKFEAQVIKKGDALLKVSPMMMEKPYLTDSFAEGPHSIKVEKDRLNVIINDGGMTHHLFKLPAKDGKLAYDEVFGEQGIKAYDEKKPEWNTPEKFNWMHQVETRPLGDLVGHGVYGKSHKLMVKTKEGKEVAVLGVINDKSDICWLHNYCSWKGLVFLLDGNCRKIGVWTIKGEKLFDIKCRELGLDYPWLTTIDITKDGTMYLGLTQSRDTKEGRSSDVTETAFLKITGLDTIKATK